ncbi:hypothetical protein ABC855_g3357 [[Candida] zeylanoides]
MSTLSLSSSNSDRHDTPYWKYHVLKFGKDLYLTTNPDLKHIYCRNGPGVYVEVVPTSTDDGFSLLFRHTHGIESPPYMIISKFGPNITVDTIGEVISLPHKSHEGIPSVDYTFTFEGTVYKIGSVSRTRVSKRNMWSGKNGDEQLKYIDKRNIYFRRLVVGGSGEEQQRKEKEDLFNPAARNSVLGLFRPNEVKLKKKLIRTAKGFLDERHTDTHRHSAGSEEDLTVGTDVDKFFQDMGDGFFTGSKPADDSPDDNKLGWITIYESLQSAEQNAQFFNLVLVRPLPLERIGAIVSPVFFNIFIFIHVVTFCLSMYLEYYHRRIGKLIKFAKPKVQTLLANWSLAVGILAQLFFIIQSIVGTVLIQRGRRADTHYAVLLAVFGILVMISLALNFVNYYIMGQYYRNYVNGEVWNKFMISFVCKVVWWLTSLTLAVTTCIFYVKGNLKVSSIFEWTFHLWYGLLLAFWTYDLYPITEMRALREKANNTRSKRSHVMNKLLWSKKVAVRDSIIEADSILDEFEFETTPFAHLPYSMPHG